MCPAPDSYFFLVDDNGVPVLDERHRLLAQHRERNATAAQALTLVRVRIPFSCNRAPIALKRTHVISGDLGPSLAGGPVIRRGS